MALKLKAKLGRPRTEPGEALIDLGRIDEAIGYFRLALKRRPDDPALLRNLADALVMKREHRAALPVYRQAATIFPADQELHELLAAVHVTLGEMAQGQKVLRDFFRDHPLEVWSEAKTEGPTILRLSGMDGTFCWLGAKRNKRPRPRYRGGHFTTTHLLPRDRYRVLNWTIAENNINRRDDVPAHALLLNTIAEPDTERRSLVALSEYLKRRPDNPIINHPDRILETTRDNNYRRLNVLAGVAFPRTVRFAREGGTTEKIVARIGAMGFAYPIIVRETGTHTARTVALVHDDAELTGYFTQSDGEDFYLIQYIDERIDEGRYFNKKRFFCIDGRLYPVVSHIDGFWNVRGTNRLTVMQKNPWMLEQEQRYLIDPAGAIGAGNFRILEGLYGLIGLDFFGVDYTVRRDGTLLIYELNASMRHSDDHSVNFPYMQPHIDRITEAFGKMIERKIA